MGDVCCCVGFSNQPVPHLFLLPWYLDTVQELKERALSRYNLVRGQGPERLVSGSDDFTLFLWSPAEDKKPLARMTGHQALVNQVLFSPDSRLVASASFDKSIKLWDGRTGKYLASLRGHVAAVYQIAWSADSRLLVSGSSDSTLKVGCEDPEAGHRLARPRG